MVISKQKFRELLFLYLYTLDVKGEEEEGVEDLIMEVLKVTKKSAKEAMVRALAIWEHVGEIDSLIQEVSSGYALERIQRVERSILRLALFEMLHDAEVPKKVAIAEAIRLTRKFSTGEAACFVNAVLDSIHKREEDVVAAT